MLFAVLNGNGSMAQYNHTEFAGWGQWMQGGMLMLGDMFNYSLKGRVDALCSEISGILANQPATNPALSPAPTQSSSPGPETAVFSAIERLGDLNAKGILSDEEFAQKKAELLRRL